MAITLRAARREEAKAIKELIHRVNINPMDLDWRRFTLAVDENDHMVGCAQVKPHSGGSCELASLAVEEGYRGQGIARLLIETLISREQPPIYLICRPVLVTLYEKFGFKLVPASQRPIYYRRMWRVVAIIHFFFPKFDGPRLMVWKD